MRYAETVTLSTSRIGRLHSCTTNQPRERIMPYDEFELLVFLNWTNKEVDDAEQAAHDEYAAQGIAHYIAFTYGYGASQTQPEAI